MSPRKRKPNNLETEKNNGKNGDQNDPAVVRAQAVPKKPMTSTTTSDKSKPVEEETDPQKRLMAAWSAEGPTRIVQCLAMYRFILFMILVYDYATYLPHQPWNDPYHDTWFTYDQFEFLTYQLAPKFSNPVWGNEASRLLYYGGCALGITAALGGIPGTPYSFEFCATALWLLYAFRFFAFVHIFTNHHYLFLLLAFLVIVAGGGSYFPPPGFTTSDVKDDKNTNDNPSTVQQKRQQRQKQRLTKRIQKSEWGAIMLRTTYAVVYFFASLWKFTPDWLDGTICKNIFTSFEDQNVNRGVAWKQLYAQHGPMLFRIVALGGIILDSSMFLALTMRRPTQKSTRLFTILSMMFHGFVCFTMSQRIGYTFPCCCLAGSLIFQPIGRNDQEREQEARAYAASKKTDDNNDNNDKAVVVAVPVQALVRDEGNLLEWIYRYIVGGKQARASPRQRCFALVWAFLQLAIPFRMPIITGGSFPYTSRAYRFSWTMMLHGRNAMLMHHGNHTLPNGKEQPFGFALDLMQLYPECADLVPIMRANHSPKSVYAYGDPRSISMIPDHHGVVQVRQRAVVDQFPRHVARVAGGWSNALWQFNPEACRNPQTGEKRPMSVYGVLYTQLNGKGPYCRAFDPTVNLAKAEVARRQRSVWETIVGVVLDIGPPGYEYLLTKGMGSLSHKVPAYQQMLETQYPEATKITFIADRAACLTDRPFTLWPSGFPFGVILLEKPDMAAVRLSRRDIPSDTPPEKQFENLEAPKFLDLRLNKLEVTTASMFEISTRSTKFTHSFPKCIETTQEDILIALVYMA
ncbi:expressed unknown protein [Seminavis robusta]|uniref:HTTM domain-containing protein n=1 Tax=Seminavis robusta TaxID=568900 RepID=A0A9N8HCS4_9STRA|nr:expressed unknown protein [Seminavis robusta]|eukprot:Sro231_g093550.1 n/a (801) ;mRNA; r:26099-28596